jgi:hypothetical protein
MHGAASVQAGSHHQSRRRGKGFKAGPKKNAPGGAILHPFDMRGNYRLAAALVVSIISD